MRNQEIISKADAVLGDLAAGGLLNVEQSNRFLRKAIEAPTLLRQARVVIMSSPSREINKIGFGGRIMRAGIENTGLAEGDRSKPVTSQILLNTSEVLAEVRLPYAMIEDNIERGNVNFGGTGTQDAVSTGGMVNTVIDMIGERAALDLEELALLGDTGSGDAYLALQDGYLKRMTTNVVDVASAPISRGMFKGGLQTLPNKYKRLLPSLRNFVAPNQEIEYADTLAGRETALGDARHQQIAPNYAAGVQLSGVALMPEANGFLVDPKNLIFGIQRQVSFEVDKDISSRQFIVVVSARVALQIEEEEATVKYTNIGAIS